MTYIDGYVDREKNIVHIVERNAQGARNFVTYPTQYQVYWPQPSGKYVSIFGDRLAQFQTTRYQEFQRELRMLSREKIMESDIDPLFRCLYQNYRDSATPQLHVGFFDIEVDFDPDRGYSTPEDAFNEITAVSVYLAWMQRCFTLVRKPRTWSLEQAHLVLL